MAESDHKTTASTVGYRINDRSAENLLTTKSEREEECEGRLFLQCKSSTKSKILSLIYVHFKFMIFFLFKKLNTKAFDKIHSTGQLFFYVFYLNITKSKIKYQHGFEEKLFLRIDFF